MDLGTNAKSMQMNEEIPLKLGYVGIKGRTQEDVNNNMQVSEALIKEKKWFAEHPIYAHMPANKTGTGALVSTLSTTMYTHIRRTLPQIVAEIDEKIYDCETNLTELGNPMPMDEKEKLKMLWEMISAFSEKFKSSILSTYNEKNKKYRQELMGNFFL